MLRNPLNTVLISVSLLGTPFAASAQQPSAVETVTGMTYLNGGIGKTEADATRRMVQEFPLRLSFSIGSANELAAQVPEAISDTGGNPVLARPTRVRCFM